MSSRPTRTEWQFVTAIKLITRINYVIFVMSFHCSLWSIKQSAIYDVCYLLQAKNECIYFSKEYNCLVRYSTVQYGLVRFLCRFRTTFCASFQWCWPLDTHDVTPGDIVDIFSLIGRVLVVVFARVSIGKTISNAHHDVSRKDVSGCSAACCRIADLG